MGTKVKKNINKTYTNNGQRTNSPVLDITSDIADVDDEESITTSTQDIFMNPNVPLFYPEWHSSSKSEAEIVNHLK